MTCFDVLEEYSINHLHFNFDAIRRIKFMSVNFTILQSFFEQLPIQQLESMTIEMFNKRNDSEDMDQQIWSTIVMAG
jgi:hypothetical protein